MQYTLSLYILFSFFLLFCVRFWGKGSLRSWLKASGIQMGQVSRQNREQKRIRELEAENRSLCRQLGEKDEVIDVLKKSVGILSKP